MHGGHQEPHTLTTRTVPARSALLHGLPSRVVPSSSHRLATVGDGQLLDGAVAGDVTLAVT